MKLLVTGGAGFIGSHVADAFIAGGHEVVVLDNLSTGKRENVHPQARLITTDITEPQLHSVFADERFDVVSHHAAQVSVNRSVQSPLDDARINILGSINLLAAAVKTGVKKVIYSSSGGAIYGNPRALPATEDCPVRPVSPYGVSKHTVEHYLTLYATLHGLRFTSLRYPNVYGPRQDPGGEGGVIAIFIDRMLRNRRTTINGTGEQQRDYLYVSDCAAANLLALNAGDGGMYNLGSGVGTSVNHLFAQLSALTGYEQPPSYRPTTPGEVARIFLDTSRAGRELNWRPSVELHEGLRMTVDYARRSCLAATLNRTSLHWES
jgi:UDP-glucose 4-epimerase